MLRLPTILEIRNLEKCLHRLIIMIHFLILGCLGLKTINAPAVEIFLASIHVDLDSNLGTYLFPCG